MALDRGSFDGITCRIGRKRECLGDRGHNLLCGSAAVADQKCCGMNSVARTIGRGAGHIGTDGSDPVSHPLALEEFQGAIDGGRLGGLTIKTEAGDKIIGLDGLTSRQEQFENPAARRGHPVTICQAALLGLQESPLNGLFARCQL